MTEMTDAEVTAQVERAMRFREALRGAVNDAIGAVDPHSLCAVEARAGLSRIAATIDDVDIVLLANLANMDLAMTRCTGDGLMPFVEVLLLATGSGPTLDFADAASFLARFERVVDAVRKLRIN